MPVSELDPIVSAPSRAAGIMAEPPIRTEPARQASGNSTVPAKKARKRGNRKLLLTGAAAMALCGVAVFAYLNHSHRIEYVTARIDRGDIEPTVTTSGNLNAVITVQVGSQVSGNIIALYADFNTKVKKGQLVALIDPAPFKAAVEQARASLNAATAGVVTTRATLAKSQSDLASVVANVANQNANVVKANSAVGLAKLESERAQTLLTEQIASQEAADTAKAAYDQAVASMDAAKAGLNAALASADSAQKQVDVARAQLDQATAVVQQDAAVLAQAQLNLDHTRILAPLDGTVESRNMDVGQTVAASFQAPIIFLIAQDLTKMQVDTNVDEADVAPIRLGQQASFTVDAYPGQLFTGRVAQIRKAPINVQNVITYDVVIEVSNPDLKLFPGMTANAAIVTGHAPNALRIPKAALRFRPRITQGMHTKSTPSQAPKQGAQQPQAMQTVYVLDNEGQPRPVRVKLGVADANYVQLLGDNLAERQQVVIGSLNQPASTTSQLQTRGSTRRSGL